MHSRIFLVRHGATVLTAEDRFAGATEVELSDEGREQVRRLADRLGGEKIVAVYASPMGRTVETARLLAGPHGLEVQTRDGLREISHGHWEQMTRKEVDAAFPEEAAAWEKDPYTFATAGGESGLAVTAPPSSDSHNRLPSASKARSSLSVEPTKTRRVTVSTPGAATMLPAGRNCQRMLPTPWLASKASRSPS